MLKSASKSINLLNESSINTQAFDHSFDSYADVSNVVLEGLDLLSGVHPVVGGQLPLPTAYNFSSK